MKGWIVVVAASAALAGCVNPVKSVQTLPADELPRIGVARIDITANSPDVPQEVQVNLKAALEKHLASCANGDLKRAIVVRIDNFKKRNVGAVMLLGDSNNLAGQVQFFDPADTNKPVGDYYVDEIRSGGGLLGLALLDNAEQNMPDRFARSVCKRVFNKESAVPAT
jgi:hypothetical protein